MGQLALSLESMGHRCKIAELPGHRGSLQEMKEIEIDQWREITEESAKDCDTLLGFSLGGLLALDLYYRRPESLQSLILFAPAIGIKKFCKLVAKFPFPNQMVLPSANSRKYIHHYGTSLKAYRQLFALENEVLGRQKEIQLPVLHFYHKKDEFLDYQQQELFFQSLSTKGYQSFRIDTTPRMLKAKHLIIEPEVLGQNLWLKLQSEMDSFLKKSPKNFSNSL